LGLPYWSLSGYLKLKVKKAVNFISDFETAVANEARKLGYQGVICGHIHHAEIRNIDGIVYCNDGDWVESCTALVEHSDGRLEILKFNPNCDTNSIKSTHAPVDRVDVQSGKLASV
jgi:UDP-2,3-diacylglucosamine pyrophosphatase LpxH